MEIGLELLKLGLGSLSRPREVAEGGGVAGEWWSSAAKGGGEEGELGWKRRSSVGAQTRPLAERGF